MFILIASAVAHMHLSSPPAQFPPEFVSNANAPASLCSLIPYYPGSDDILIPGFNNDLKAKGFSSLRDYADACAKAAQAKSCGNSIPDAVVPIPSDGTVQIDVGANANHIGPSEVWVDDILVMYNPGMIRGTIQKTPPVSRVDYSQVCLSGSCRVRFVMVALHNFPAEIFDNCVTIGKAMGPVPKEVSQGTAATGVSVGSSPFSSPPLVPESGSAQSPIDTATNQAYSSPSETTGGSEWSCSSDSTGLVRTVGSDRNDFACPTGTKCSTINVPYAMCVTA